MLVKGEKSKTITLQDDSERQVFDPTEYIRLIGDVVDVLNTRDPNSPLKNYENSLLENSEDRDAFVDYAYCMAQQLRFLTGKLKSAHLPVTMPDGKYFLERFKLAKESSSEIFDQIIRFDSRELLLALKTSVDKNIDFALRYGIEIPTKSVFFKSKEPNTLEK